MEWVIESYDRRTDRDGENRFTTEVAFMRAGEDLLRNGERGVRPTQRRPVRRPVGGMEPTQRRAASRAAGGERLT
jgi:hypothetical protein